MGDMRIVRRTFVKGALASGGGAARAACFPRAGLAEPAGALHRASRGRRRARFHRAAGRRARSRAASASRCSSRTAPAARAARSASTPGSSRRPTATISSSANDNVASAPHVLKLNVDYLKDLMPVSLLGRQPQVLAVHPSLEVKSVAELVAAVKKLPSLGCATSGVGSNQHVLMEWFAKVADIKLEHVPYRGAGQAINDLVAGHVKVAFLGPTATLPHAAAQKIRLLAQSGEARSPSMPDLPTLQEAGYPGVVARILVRGVRAARHAARRHRAAQCRMRQGARRKVRARHAVQGRDRAGRRRHRAARQARARGLREVRAHRARGEHQDGVMPCAGQE